MLCIMHEAHEIFDFLCAQGAELNEQLENGMSALTLAIKLKQEYMTTKLIEYGAEF